MPTYVQLLQAEEKKAKDRIAEYTAKRQQRAAEDAAEVAAVYEQQQLANREQARQTAAQTAQSYREMYDMNAVEELTARRRAAEAIANSNMANSGLNNTQQTAISLMRGRADTETTAQRQAAIDRVMQTLDELNAEASMASAERQSAVYADAYDDIDSYHRQAMEQAATNTHRRFQEEGDDAVYYMGGTVNADLAYNPSYHTIRSGALAQQYLRSDDSAANYVDRMLTQGHLTADEWKEIMDWLDLPTVDETYETYEQRLTKILKTQDESQARKFIQYLSERGAIDQVRAEELRAFIYQ